MKKITFLYIVCLIFSVFSLYAQKPKHYNSSEIQQKLQKLKVLGNVLYVAAHPDDENTNLITYFANGQLVNAAYFSCTRGDGGQNLIGPEIRDELGVIRTQELLTARSIDNGEQFFSRAVDFGYSKNPDETFNIWNKEEVLSDLVWVIRNFRPDIIITRFNTIPGGNHGHHTASAILAEEAFDAAGDKTRFPDQLKNVDTWQPKSLYWNTYWWRRDDFQKDTSELVSIDIGAFNQLLGQSYSEIAALSRSSHKSQGFGVTGSRGTRKEYLQFIKGQKAEKNAFEVVDLSWNKIIGGKDINIKIDHLIESFDPANPVGILKEILNIRREVSKIHDTFWKQHKLQELDELIYAITGLFLEVKSGDFTAFPGEEISLDIEAINRSSANIKLKKISFDKFGIGEEYDIELKNNNDQQLSYKMIIPESAEYSQPYWLVKKHGVGMFDVDNQLLIGKPENDPAVTADFLLNVEGEDIHFNKPVIYKRNDPVKGEVYQPFVIAPPVYVNIYGSVVIFANHASQMVKLDVKAGKDSLKGTVRLDLPNTWKIKPLTYDLQLSKKGEIASFTFEVTPPAVQETSIAKAIVQIDDHQFSNSYTEINYDHIPEQLLFNSDEVKFVKLDLEKGDEKIGYLMGAGDNIPENLRQIGYQVDLINDLEFNEQVLDQFDVIILGVRALNTVDRLKYDMEKLLAFVYRGGNLIVQYNTNNSLVAENIGPFPLTLSRERVTDENSKIDILAEKNPMMNFPNKISQKDFEGWVQERGLYFPGKWSDEFVPILSCHDPGEDALNGGLLEAKYGKGNYIYTGYSWFRELPEGVPGAYRIFVNMISAGENHQ